MAVIYEFWNPEGKGILPLTDANGNYVGFVIGLKAIDEETQLSEYIDTQVNIDPAPPEEWPQFRILQLAVEIANKPDPETGKNWFQILKERLEAQKGRPIIGTRIVL